VVVKDERAEDWDCAVGEGCWEEEENRGLRARSVRWWEIFEVEGSAIVFCGVQFL